MKSTAPTPSLSPELEAELVSLDADMPQLQLRHTDPFALANAWAERYEAILRRTPPQMLHLMQAQLLRIGIRWGVMPGSRVTTEFPALPPE